MGLVVTRSFQADPVEITIPQAGNKKDVEFTLPKLGYISYPITSKVDAWTTQRFTEVTAYRAEQREKGNVVPDSDPLGRYPSPLDVMEQMIGHLDPKAAAAVSELSYQEKQDIWEYWNSESAPAAPEKSSASSDSSDATE
ncbi:hypothetical protein CH302_23675 [Rhodococcus sp. 15-2388-1-1a]|uniref:hypothetical protein n=1 Tax=Nocardiaceae TaxID=85025 RepID=UPI0005601775|nr:MULTISPECIES: hypothetical protein [Rhodococcus]OZE92116.1 hypothetical protein CH302_23675 [Rhodococcus sp. 15-2388-1-1a]